MSSDEFINIYTDGSCINNGRSDAIASIGIWIQQFPDISISERITSYPQTNQVAELYAIKRALETADNFEKINIFTDSKYAMNCVTQWYLKWEKNNWKTSKGKSPINMDLIKEIIIKLRSMRSIGKIISFTYVPGHSGHEGNEVAHRLAMNTSRSG